VKLIEVSGTEWEYLEGKIDEFKAYIKTMTIRSLCRSLK
jgi:hypothetical protein